MGSYSGPLPKQSDLQKAAGYPNGLPKHSPLGLYAMCPASSLHSLCSFNLMVPEESIQDYRDYVDTKVVPCPAIPKEARELLWCLRESTARRIKQTIERHEHVELDDDPDAPDGSDRLTEEEIDREYGFGHAEPVIAHNELGGVYALKTTWTLGELSIAGPYLPPYVTLNGMRVRWETKAMALQSAMLAGEPDELIQHLANLLSDEDYRGHPPLVDTSAEPGDPLEVEMPEQVGIHPEFALMASLEATNFDQSLGAYKELNAVGTAYAETNNPPRPINADPSLWGRVKNWVRDIWPFSR